MLMVRKSVKWIVAIILMMQLISFSGLAASSILLQSVPTELVERARSIEAGEAEFEKTLDFDREISNIKTFLSFQGTSINRGFLQSSTFLVFSNKVCCIKLKVQNFHFFNTIKRSLLVKLLPQAHIIFIVKSS